MRDDSECVEGEDENKRVTSTHRGGDESERVEGEDQKARMTIALHASAFSAIKGIKPKLALGVTLSSLAKNNSAR